jgi:ATP-dependent RNA helicase RhlE
MQQGFVKLHQVGIFILDEADRMLDMGFIHDVRKVVAKVPPRRQTLFFSATMPPAIRQLASTLLTNPITVEVTPVSSTAEKIAQSLYFVSKEDKIKLLRDVLGAHRGKPALVFTRTKHGADKLVKMLGQANIPAQAIHGNKSQNARQRALRDFKEGRLAVLVATDIAARGIDVDGLALVVNYEISNEAETYVHRIGRTGRAGASGLSASFCDCQERGYVRSIEKLIGKKIPVVEDHPYVDRSPERAPDPIGGGNRGRQGGGNYGKGTHRGGHSGHPQPRPHGAPRPAAGGGTHRDHNGPRGFHR